MYFKQFMNERCGCASYLIASRRDGIAAVVDPALETAQYEEVLGERGFTLAYVIDTHVHADHLSGARRLAAAHGAELCLQEQAEVTYPHRSLADGDALWLGPIRLDALHTPGHRREMMSLLVTNTERSPEPALVLTGDSLLVGDVGRPDFGGGDARQQHASIDRLLALPDWVAVFPGHFEGACGAGMCGRPSSTIGFERRFNPLVGLSRPAFVERLCGTVPPRPLNMNAIEPTNRGRLDRFDAMPLGNEPVPQIEVADVGGLLAGDGVFLLDVREPEEFAAGHLPGATSIPQCDLALRLDEIPRNRPVLVVCQAGRRSQTAARWLAEQGWPLVASLRGGTGAWQEAGRPLEGGPVSARELAAV